VPSLEKRQDGARTRENRADRGPGEDVRPLSRSKELTLGRNKGKQASQLWAASRVTARKRLVKEREALALDRKLGSRRKVRLYRQVPSGIGGDTSMGKGRLRAKTRYAITVCSDDRAYRRIGEVQEPIVVCSSLFHVPFGGTSKGRKRRAGQSLRAAPVIGAFLVALSIGVIQAGSVYAASGAGVESVRSNHATGIVGTWRQTKRNGKHVGPHFQTCDFKADHSLTCWGTWPPKSGVSATWHIVAKGLIKEHLAVTSKGHTYTRNVVCPYRVSKKWFHLNCRGLYPHAFDDVYFRIGSG
jgi:hypothetical protein